jgi:hypothetical protein
MVGLVEVLRGLQQGFRRNATHVGARTAKGWAPSSTFPFIHTGHLKTQLGCAYGGNITTRAATNDDHIKLFTHANS